MHSWSTTSVWIFCVYYLCVGVLAGAIDVRIAITAGEFKKSLVRRVRLATIMWIVICTSLVACIELLFPIALDRIIAFLAEDDFVGKRSIPIAVAVPGLVTMCDAVICAICYHRALPCQPTRVD